MRAAIALAVGLAAAGSAGCLPLAEGEIAKDITLTVPIQTVPGGGILGDLLDLGGYEFPFSSSQIGSAQNLELTRSITLEELALRTVLPGAQDRTDAALRDPGRVGTCRPGQAPITFIRRMEITIRKAGTANAATPIAVHEFSAAEQGRTDICGFFFEIDNSINLKDFLPQYEVAVTAQGSAPDDDTEVGGYASVLFVGELELPPQR